MILRGLVSLALSSSEPHPVFRPNSDADIRCADHNLDNAKMATVAGAVQYVYRKHQMTHRY